MSGMPELPGSVEVPAAYEAPGSVEVPAAFELQLPEPFEPEDFSGADESPETLMNMPSEITALPMTCFTVIFS